MRTYPSNSCTSGRRFTSSIVYYVDLLSIQRDATAQQLQVDVGENDAQGCAIPADEPRLLCTG
jgi:hypothetical protein